MSFRVLQQVRRCGLTALLVTVAAAGGVAAQTDYYNTDAGRPVRIEDAYPTERYAFELQLAPLRLERQRGGIYNWEVEPEIAYGLFPRTHIEIGFPLAYSDRTRGRGTGLAGIDLSMLRNLNVETETLPALALAAEAVLPVGSLAPGSAFVSAKGIMTRTYGFARFHVNGSYTFGSARGEDEHAVEEISRWLAGVAVDKTMPLRSMLVIGEVYAREPIAAGAEIEWNAGAGIRYQLNPRLAVDGGVGKRLSGSDPAWFVTFGTAYAFALRSLMPVQ